jgi:peptidoglycan/LPS O-acetylase OafA/YrhL
VAIALVLLRHSWPDHFGGAGVVGVVVFFALSGYLITGLLLRDIDQFGRVRYSRFYAHRAFRLLPALFGMLVVFAITEMIFNVNGDRWIVLQSAAAAVLYLMDLPLPFDTSVAVNHLWTLSIEEQFYLVWPWLLAVFIRRGALARFVLFALIFSLLTCLFTVVMMAHNPAQIYILPTTWASAMVLGAWAYVHRDRIDRCLERSPILKVVLPTVACILLATISVWPAAKDSAFLYSPGGPLIAASALILVFRLRSWRTVPTMVLEPLRLLGLISYAVYLWNPLVLSWINASPQLPSWLAIPATILAGVASWFSVESCGRFFRRRFDSVRAATVRQT